MQFHYGYVNDEGESEEKHLQYLARISTLIHSTLPRFPNLAVLKLDFGNILSRSDGCIKDEGRGGTPYWVQDTKDLYRSFSTAISRSGLDKLEELDLSLSLGHDYGYFLDDENEVESSSTRFLFKHLKRLRVDVAHNTEEESLSHQVNAKYVQELLPLASNLESLRVESPGWLRLTASALPHSHLRLLYLEFSRIAGEALISIIERCTSLQEVFLHEIIIESGTWEEVFTALRKTSIVALDIHNCGYEVGGYPIQYLHIYDKVHISIFTAAEQAENLREVLEGSQAGSPQDDYPDEGDENVSDDDDPQTIGNNPSGSG
ncbi:hypothetical protein FVEN_g147 [Fusarium venenatum]|nr:hypothetical protein FVEN_g147 [Fusarium venenatum]